MADAPLIVLHIQWAEGATSRQETFGPWPVAADESHLERIFAFIRAWPSLTGFQPSQVTMALVIDPDGWAAEREAARG